jgi:hypothetical protein
MGGAINVFLFFHQLLFLKTPFGNAFRSPRNFISRQSTLPNIFVFLCVLLWLINLMPFLRRVLFLLLGLPITTFAADSKAQPPAPPVAVPAFLDVVSFAYDADGENHKVVVTSAPTLLRVDEPDDRYSVIYNPATDFYIGLEHGNYTYWEFSWPDVRQAVESSKRHEARLQDLSNEGINGDDTMSGSASSSSNTNTAASSDSGDDSGYVWRATNDKKRINGLDCVRWTGDTVSGENVEAWCYAAPLPKVQAAVEHLRLIDEPMALVPVRNIVPDFIFPVFAGLTKGGVTPLEINWGDGQEKHHFRLIESGTREGKLSLFTVPKLYTKTTLITMDGMTDQQPVTERKSEPLKKTWQNP